MKKGYKFPDNEKDKRSAMLKKMWADGVFDSPETRAKWKATAADRARLASHPHKVVPSQEMLDDLSRMNDPDFCTKWNVSRRIPIRIRKEYGIKPFVNQYGLREHKVIDGIEHKWCGAGHWESVENFGSHASRWDGLRGHCKEHSNESSRKAKKKEYSTPEGKAKMRFYNSRRKTSIVLWELQDEQRAFELYKSRCGYCGKAITRYSVEFDHLVPVSKGGLTTPSNMIPSCKKCNRGVGGKGSRDVDEWLNSKFGEDLGQSILMQIQQKQAIISEETKLRFELSVLENYKDY